jgi:transcriptional regulator with XRE-family HTH domain
MLNLEQLRTALDDRNVEKVAERTGIHRNTIGAIRSGSNQNPSYATMKALSDYLTGVTADAN